ncbi:MAG: 4-hydroxythreonine-4-phosphate dehydrogenase PdxA [SAR202 cluster bacterium]|jgi:4-hydroxythreonine-4-phosphate dehydrogenase|nr:4-hydroxythreonine-4-phosphate dehydrogenase PdxA [SAR202 cluster bacterium]MDP7102864.1 4-hydroxythreonine-4-phosphate dehydrogenase PdxA [SAR202 cluster bacterium]MDP7224344.1 4-hydroxythreonine-4-phosphate dehydrogenase PdxA [SAR202 cluster bacterium]MDP7413351.1 4-hydroxythreonine-4-phosphate dehydrogenase PdxA [SAR202 cluster bacterium]|tara:strand:- start:404 stop:1408 length:1005 start_codon:yes stop_codon:yes gene_type:complete
MTDRPLVAVTMGDAAGIGPEIIVRALQDPWIFEKCRPFVIGSAAAINAALELIEASGSAHLAHNLDEVEGNHGAIDVLDLENLNYGDVEYGQISAASGNAAAEWVLRAGELAAAGQIAAIATAPINKEACNLAGYTDIGHTEIFKTQTKSPDVATMLMAGKLRVVHLTTHKSLRVACDFVTRENVLAKIKLTDEYFKKWGFDAPRVGVAGLNPHNSDGGLLGSEEAEQIEPAVEDARKMGIDATGPVPADSVFNQGIDGKFDAVLAMYHDQGHIPIKVHDFEKSVSVNLGLPFIRTSVDHGTAFDIAGKGIAQAESMLESIKTAVSLASDGRLP